MGDGRTAEATPGGTMKRSYRLLSCVLLTGMLIASFAPPAHAATYDSTGDLWSSQLTGCRTRAQATITPSGAQRRVDWYTSSSCSRAVDTLRTIMTVSWGWPLNVIHGPATTSCINCSFVSQSGTYYSPPNELHHLTAEMRVLETVTVAGGPFGVWTPAPLVPCAPTVWNYALFPGWGACITNTVYNTSG